MLLLISIAVCYLWISRQAARFIFSEAGVIPFRESALVLGTAKLTSRGGLNLYFQYRMDAAASLFNENKCTLFIVSGAGKGRVHIPEADEMKKDLTERGIPSDVVIVDHAGFRTWDSLWRCRGSFGWNSFTVVSQKFHVQRAVFTGHRLGLDVIGFCAEGVRGKTQIRMFIRECLARVKCILDCYALHPKPVYMRKMRRSHFKRRHSKKHRNNKK